MKTRTSILLLAYAALLMSLFLPSKANEMTSQLGEHVKAWEPSIALHFRILFSPLIEWFDYREFISMSERPDGLLADMWRHISYWLPITLTGWLFLTYPALQRLRGSALRRFARYSALLTTALGTGFLIHHLIGWATIYDGFYHMGGGGYFLMAAYFLLTLLIFFDINSDRDAADAAGRTSYEERT